MLSDLRSGVLQTHQALQEKTQSYSLGKMRLPKVFNKGEIIMANFGEKHLFHNVISHNFQLFYFKETLDFCHFY